MVGDRARPGRVWGGLGRLGRVRKALGGSGSGSDRLVLEVLL